MKYNRFGLGLSLEIIIYQLRYLFYTPGYTQLLIDGGIKNQIKEEINDNR